MMPNSFSRFLNDEELQKVRELYLQSLQDAEDEEEGEEPERDTDARAADEAGSALATDA